MTSPTPHDSGADDDALELDAQATIAKALQLYEAGEKELAERLFDRLRQRVLKAGPTALLIGGGDSGQTDPDLREVVGALADITRAKPGEDSDGEAA